MTATIGQFEICSDGRLEIRDHPTIYYLVVAGCVTLLELTKLTGFRHERLLDTNDEVERLLVDPNTHVLAQPFDKARVEQVGKRRLQSGCNL